MRRRLFTLACVASAALLLAAVAVWGRSYRAADSLSVLRRFGDPNAPGHGYTHLSLHWSTGTINLGGGTVLDRLPPDERRVTWTSIPAGRMARRESPWLMFRWAYSSQPERVAGWSRGTVLRRWRLTVPCWAAALAAAAMPAWWATRRRAASRATRRASRGQCAGCGYDLTGNVSGVCPECGTAAGAVVPGA